MLVPVIELVLSVMLSGTGALRFVRNTPTALFMMPPLLEGLASLSVPATRAVAMDLADPALCMCTWRGAGSRFRAGEFTRAQYGSVCPHAHPASTVTGVIAKI